MGVLLELLGASGLSTLWSAVTATSTEERLETILCAPHSLAQTVAMQLVRSRKPMGPLELLGARGLGTMWSAAPATSTEERLGQALVCAAQPGAGCGVQLVRSRKVRGPLEP